MRATKTIHLTFALLAIAFFTTPIAARILGVTAESFENRRFAEAPKLSQGWDAFGQTTRFLTDRMPLRAQAVRANTRIWTDLFDTQPRYAGATAADQGALPFGPDPDAGPADPEQLAAAQRASVLPGRDGWLFLVDDLRRSCSPPLAFDAAIERWRSLLGEVRGLAEQTLLVVAPDKAAIYPEHLEDGPDVACGTAAKQRLWDALAGLPPSAGVAPLRAELLRRKRGAGDDLYARTDSHWTSLGSLTLVDAVLDRIAPPGLAVRRGEIVDPGPVEHTGDLAVLLGLSDVETRVQRAIARAPDARKVPGRTVVVGDSFFDAPNPQLMPYLEQMVVLSWVNTPLPEIAAEIRRADTVVLETVERELAFRAADGGPVPQLAEILRAGRASP
jgi:alginate O-acetyltransferase complex protein AlgJ